MATHDRLPASWRGTRRDPRLPDGELSVATDGESVILFDWPEIDAYIRVPRDHCIELDGDDAVR